MEDQDDQKKKTKLISIGTGIVGGLIVGWVTRPYELYAGTIPKYFLFLTKLFADDYDGKIARSVSGHLCLYTIGGLVAGLAFTTLINAIREKK